MFSRIKGVVQLLIAAGIVAVIVWSFVVPDEGRRIEDATYAEDAQALPENEGRRVVVAGTLTAHAGAFDPDLEIDFDALEARRVVERLAYFDDDGNQVWESAPDQSDGGTLTDALFFGEASVGQFTIADDLIRRLSAPERDWEAEDVDDATWARLERRWHIVRTGSDLYLSETPDFTSGHGSDLVGSVRVRYRLRDPGFGARYTFVGIQRGQTLVLDPHLNAASVFEGALSQAEAIEANASSVLMGQIVAFVLAVVPLTYFGVRNVRDL